MTKPTLLLGLCLGSGLLATAMADTIPAGAAVPIRANETIDVRRAANERVYSAVVERDVLDRDGHVAIPRGASAELMVRDIGHHTLVLDLDSVTVGGRRYSVDTCLLYTS